MLSFGVSCSPRKLGLRYTGVDNLKVVRTVGRLLQGAPPAAPFEVQTDGDLLLVIARDTGTFKLVKVKGHVTEGIVPRGSVQIDDKEGNEEADAADLGRRGRSASVCDGRRSLPEAQRYWVPKS